MRRDGSLRECRLGKTWDGTREANKSLRMRGETHRCGQQNGPTEVDLMVDNWNGRIFPRV